MNDSSDSIRSTAADDSPAAARDLDGAVPPASFDTLVSMLASQAMVALGKIPDPMERKPVVRPRLARHFIDMIAVLQSKSAGNLTDDEASSLESLLHELRMVYVAAQKPGP